VPAEAHPVGIPPLAVAPISVAEVFIQPLLEVKLMAEVHSSPVMIEGLVTQILNVADPGLVPTFETLI
jgi:hypothetical protein